MSLYDPVFVNVNEEALKASLTKIGKVKLEEACKLRSLEMPRTLKYFKVIWENKRGSLYYKFKDFEGKREYEYILTLHHNEMPLFGWEVVFGGKKAIEFDKQKSAYLRR